MEIRRLTLMYFRLVVMVVKKKKKMSMFNSACFCIKPTEITLRMQKTR